jgi:malonyl-CoA/methylmalonyl-CoA synthetase
VPDEDTLAIVQRAVGFGRRLGLVDRDGPWTYADVVAQSTDVASRLLGERRDLGGHHDLREARVALLASPGLAYVAGQWGAWLAGGMSVPLSPQQTRAEWEYILDDSQATFAVVSPDLAGLFRVLADARGVHVVVIDPPVLASAPRPDLPALVPARRALMLYTSGTTSRPKGVVLTHANIRAQAECLIGAWGWRADDRALHVLPLNHTHGVINVLTCALWSGAVCEIVPMIDSGLVWDRLASGDITVFMAVPTIYRRLISAWIDAPELQRTLWSRGAARLRLFVSGSAALPVSVFEEWRRMTGHTLLERYGMTEIGMALSNPLDGERRPGCVGAALPGVEVRLVDEDGADAAAGEPGEILVRGPAVFLEYWRRPDATRAAFSEGGWFRTGDVAVVEGGAVRILGRLSVDIIKTGGEKVSALEIEDVLREHPAIIDCAIVGPPDQEWGECVAAAVVLEPGAGLLLEDLRTWARARLSGPKLPRRMVIVEALPRNAMGKVAKTQLIQLFEA